MFSSFLTILILLYVGNISGKIEKDNSLLKKRIMIIQDQIDINEIEYTLYNSYNYLKKLQKFIENYLIIIKNIFQIMMTKL